MTESHQAMVTFARNQVRPNLFLPPLIPATNAASAAKSPSGAWRLYRIVTEFETDVVPRGRSRIARVFSRLRRCPRGLRSKILVGSKGIPWGIGGFGCTLASVRLWSQS
jgi:hypothetical protein